MLEPLGLGELDERVYRIMLRGPAVAPVRIARRLGVPVHDVLDSRQRLVDSGLLVADTVDADRYLLVGPDLLADRMAAAIEAEATRRREQLETLRLGLSALMADYVFERTSAPQDWMERVEGADVIQHKMLQLSRRARSQVLVTQPGGPSARAGRGCSTGALPLEQRTLERGVSARALEVYTTIADPSIREQWRRLTRLGAQVRVVADLPTWMMLIDEQVGVVAEGAGVPADAVSAVVVFSRAVTGALAAMFESYWACAEPVPEFVGATPDGSRISPSEQERLLLRMLSLGVKDDMIARSMKVSVRTVRRQISDLLRRLEASSRFQAGVQAATRGWV